MKISVILPHLGNTEGGSLYTFSAYVIMFADILTCNWLNLWIQNLWTHVTDCALPI